MQNVLKVFGIVLVLTLVVWIAIVIKNESVGSTIPHVIGFGNGFDYKLGASKEDVNAILTKGNAVMDDQGHHGATFANWAHIAAWLSFGLTAVITLIAGFTGRTMPQTPDASIDPGAGAGSGIVAGVPEESSRHSGTPAPRRLGLVSLLGLLAAAASVSNGASGKFQTDADADFKRVQELSKLLTTARSQLSDKGVTPEQAGAIVEQLKADLIPYE